MSFGQIHIKAGLLAGLKRVCGRVCSDTMKVGLKQVFAATGGAPLDRLLDTTTVALPSSAVLLRALVYTESLGVTPLFQQHRGTASLLREG